MKTILHFIKKEFRQFRRDPKMFGIILLAPVIQLILLGYAVNFDITNIHTAVLDFNKTELSRKYVQALESSGYFSIDYYVNDYNQMTELIDKGKIVLGISIERDFDKNLYRNEPAKIQAILDASDGNTASIAAGYTSGTTALFSKRITAEFLEKKGSKIALVNPVTSETRVWFNPELKTRNYMVPGIVGLLLMVITLILTSLAVVKEKEIGTMEQLIVTPIKPYQMIIGKLVPFAILGFVAVSIVLTAMYVVFGIPVKGSVAFLLVSTFTYIMSTLGLGLFVSTISKTQQQAMMLAIFVVMMPMVFFSGFAFPIENMPVVIQYITYAIPLRYFMIIIRGIILKGIGIAELWPELLVLFLMGAAILSFSILRFKKNLD
jgi:ABC-2 type transport system permease protein